MSLLCIFIEACMEFLCFSILSAFKPTAIKQNHTRGDLSL